MTVDEEHIVLFAAMVGDHTAVSAGWNRDRPDAVSLVLAGGLAGVERERRLFDQSEFPRNGADLILQTDSLMGEQLYRLGLLNQRIEVWGGTQTGHWNGNGSSYIECFAGRRAFATAHTISTRSWEAEGEPRGFYPFSSRHPLRLYGVYVANQFERNQLFPESKNVLVTYGEISYGRGRILLNSSYWVDEATVFSDLLFFNMLAHYGLENDDEQPGPIPSVPTNATTQEAKH